MVRIDYNSEKVLAVSVDLIDGFMKKGPLADPKMGWIIPNVVDLFGRIENFGAAIVFCNDGHEKGDSELLVFGEHCMNGTQEAEIIEEL